MNDYGTMSLVCGILSVIFGLFSFIKVWRKHKLIDTESIAVVNSVQDLGRTDGLKVYAIKYDVKSSEPFELLVTPCKKALSIGKERTIYYEKDNPNQNHYFKSIGQFDARLLAPTFLFSIGLIVIIIVAAL
jgi:hypothetical protein